MSRAVSIKHKGVRAQIQATKTNNRHITTLSELARKFSDVRVPIRVLALAGLKVGWNSHTSTIIVKDKYPGGITKSEFDYLLRITQAEAGGEDVIGRIMVVNVIVNRLRSNSRDFINVNTIKDVIKQPRQFEPMRNGAFKRAIPTKSTREAVIRALEGEDHSKGALFFRSTRGLKGSWHKENLKYLFTHGRHAFFRQH